MATSTDVLTKNYEVEMEIAGPAAMWTRPDTGSAAVSGPGPTFSAAKGVFEAIARLRSAYIRPTGLRSANQSNSTATLRTMAGRCASPTRCAAAIPTNFQP